MFSHAKTAVLILAAATQLAVAGVTSLSPKVIDLSASELQRRAACSSPGVVNGQCGRYYRNGGCDNQIGQIAPDVSPNCYENGSVFQGRAGLTFISAAELATETRRALLALRLLGTVHTAPTAYFTRTTAVNASLGRLEILYSAGIRNATLLQTAGLHIASFAGSSVNSLVCAMLLLKDAVELSFDNKTSGPTFSHSLRCYT